VLFFAALTLHSFNITTPSLWWDEAATKSSMRNGWAGIDAITSHLDVVHKFYYQLVYLLVQVFGNSTLVLRLPSAIAAALACVAIVELCRQVGLSAWPSYLAGVFLAITPRLFWASLEARSYAMTVLTGVFVMLVFVVAAKATTVGKSLWRQSFTWFGFVLVFDFAIYLYVYQVLLVLPLAAFWFVGRPSAKARDGWFWPAASSALAVLGAIPLALTAKAQQQQVAWNRLIPVGIPGLLGSQAFMWLVPPFLITLGAFAYFALAGKLHRNALRSRTAIVALTWLLGPTGLLMVSALFGDQLYNSRYVSFTLGAWALLFAALIPATLRQIAIAAIFLVVIGANVFPEFGRMRQPNSYASDWRVASQGLAERAHPGDAVIFGDAWRYPVRRVSVMKAAYPENFRGLADIGFTRDKTQLLDWRVSWHDQAEKLKGFRTVWLVLDSRVDLREIKQAENVLVPLGYREGPAVKFAFDWLIPFRKN